MTDRRVVLFSLDSARMGLDKPVNQESNGFVHVMHVDRPDKFFDQRFFVGWRGSSFSTSKHNFCDVIGTENLRMQSLLCLTQPTPDNMTNFTCFSTNA